MEKKGGPRKGALPAADEDWPAPRGPATRAVGALCTRTARRAIAAAEPMDSTPAARRSHARNR